MNPLCTLAVALVLSGCSAGAILGTVASTALSAATGGSSAKGTAVDADVQIGRTNEKSVVLGDKSDTGDLAFGTTTLQGDLKVTQGQNNKYASEKVESVVINESNDLLLVFLAIAAGTGWVLPPPSQLVNSLVSYIRSKRKHKDETEELIQVKEEDGKNTHA